MNRPECRANYKTSMPHSMPARPSASRTMTSCPSPCESCMPSGGRKEEKKEKACTCLEDMALAIGYVPMQKFHTTFEMCKALYVGTIFPELCKPFVGKRGKKC